DHFFGTTISKVTCILSGKKSRQPKKKKPPDRIGHEFTKKECPCLAIAQQPEPRYLFFGLVFYNRFILIAVNVVVLGLRKFSLLKFLKRTFVTSIPKE